MRTTPSTAASRIACRARSRTVAFSGTRHPIAQKAGWQFARSGDPPAYVDSAGESAGERLTSAHAWGARVSTPLVSRWPRSHLRQAGECAQVARDLSQQIIE